LREIRPLPAFLFGVALAALLVFVAPRALADDFGTDCSHGNSNQECRPDPQPEHGKDCDQPNGDGNEDHCASPEPTASPTPSPSVEPTLICWLPEGCEPCEITPGCDVVTPSPTPTTSVSGVGGGGSSSSKRVDPKPLPKTGVGIVVLAVAGLALIAFGLTLHGRDGS
jgi:hypothetical protein